MVPIIIVFSQYHIGINYKYIYIFGVHEKYFHLFILFILMICNRYIFNTTGISMKIRTYNNYKLSNLLIKKVSSISLYLLSFSTLSLFYLFMDI